MNPKNIQTEIPEAEVGPPPDVPQVEIALAGRAAELVMAANDLLVTDEASQKNAIDLTAQIKAAFDLIETDRDDLVRPLFTLTRGYNGQFKAVTDPLQAAEKKLKTLILAFQRAEQKKIDDAAAAQAKADREAQEKYEREQAEHEAAQEAADVGEEDVTIPTAPVPPPAPAPPPPTNAPAYGNYGAKATAKQKWVHEVEDLSAVPLKYLTVDDRAVKQAIKDGVRKILGVRIFDEGVVAFNR